MQINMMNRPNVCYGK